MQMGSFAPGMELARQVSKGELVGLSSNTGRLTAPHLHYELQSSSGRILDPFEIHETYRDSVPEEQMQRFRAEMARIQSRLEPAEVYAADR